MCKKMDTYSFRCGVIDAFAEVVHAGVKKMAYSHATTSRELFEDDQVYARVACEKYGISMYVEEDMLTTDLFARSTSLDHLVVILYDDPTTLEAYLGLKKQKADLIKNGAYTGNARRAIAVGLGHLLSYSDEKIASFIDQNTDKE